MSANTIKHTCKYDAMTSLGHAMFHYALVFSLSINNNKNEHLFTIYMLPCISRFVIELNDYSEVMHVGWPADRCSCTGTGPPWPGGSSAGPHRAPGTWA